MPYPNEHAARLRNPDDFDPKSFRRTDGGMIYGKIKVPKTVAIIWGKLKGKAKPSDNPVPQALRFAKENWTAEKARKWLKDNGVKYISFEPAGSSSRQAAGDPVILKEIAENPFIFTMPGLVEFAETSPDKPKNKVKLTLYDGSIVDHWYWGKLAFDQKTMRMAKKRNPILFTHDVTQRIAVSDTTVFEPKFVMEGDFLKTSPLAQGVKAEMDEGFPFEASLRFDPDKSTLEHIKEGETGEVNGHKLKGPGTIIRNALILEGSICVFGALKNTQSQAFETILHKENIMPEEITNMTLAELTGENFSTVLPEIYNQVLIKGKAEGEQAGKQRFADLQKVCGDDAALIVQCLSEGKTAADAASLRMIKLQAETKRLAEENAALKAKRIDPAVPEFSDTAPAPGTSGKFDEAKATDAQLKEHFAQTQDLKDRFSSAEAYIAGVRHPAK